MYSDYQIKLAYFLGCKVAEIANANAMAERLNNIENKENSTSTTRDSSYKNNIMQNGEFRAQTEAGTQYGPKHQIAVTPEWGAT